MEVMKMEDVNKYENYSIYIKTVSAGIIRALVESLKGLLMDVNIYFDSQGLKIMSMDGKRIAMVHLSLEAVEFEEFYCHSNIQVGLNMESLFKLLKTADNSSILILYIKKTNISSLGVRIENKEKNIVSDSLLKLLDLNDPLISIPEIDFEFIITIPCVEFNRYCSDLKNFSDIVEISTWGNVLKMHVEADFGEKTISIAETQQGTVCCKSMLKNGGSIKSKFSLVYLTLFSKSGSLCSNIEIYMKSGYPIFLSYSVANLGRLRLGLAPLLE